MKANLIRAMTVLPLVSVLASACAAPGFNIANGTSTVVGPPVTSNDTPYSACLQRLADAPGDNLPSISVGDIRDKTGQRVATNYSGSTVLTQGVSEMLISALYKTRKVHLLERLDTSVSALENRFSQLGMGKKEYFQADISPSDFVILGALTELNYNIVSQGARLYIAGVGGGSKQAVINVGLDLRVIDAKTLRTVYSSSLQKQIIGYEAEAGVYRFFGNHLIEFDIGRLRNEPIQVGVRSVVEMAVLQIMLDGFKLPKPDGCDFSM
jgi:curli biogenesis system outer membrane secretion channel CsgG